MPASEFYTDRLNIRNSDSLLIIMAILAFIAVVRIPSALNSDIQPWDEGMYAARVNSVNINGDFFDQSAHSVGRFYSGSHPPLLIWLGYFSSVIFGFNPFVLKLLSLLISMSAVFALYFIGFKNYEPMTGILAVMIFAGNILFTVFSVRFQLDMLYVLFMLLSLYFILRFTRKGILVNSIFAGCFLGLCLLSKILVGLFIPLTLFLSIALLGKRAPCRFGQALIITAIGILIALPWHVSMYLMHGSQFTDYFFGFHLFERAVKGVEMNQKGSGIFYFVNYFLTIIPFGVLLLFAFINNIRQYSRLSSQTLFLWIWTILGFLIISIFKTKLESYILLVLPAASLLIANYLKQIQKEKPAVKVLILVLIFVNAVWFATEVFRPEIKHFLAEANLLLEIVVTTVALLFVYFMCKWLSNTFNLRFATEAIIILVFISTGLYYFANPPLWENRFRIREISAAVKESGAKGIVYVGSNYRFNPQFSYYFDGIDLGWKHPKYIYEFMDTNIGTEKVKARLTAKDSGICIIVEKDKINRSDYPESETFIPDDFRLIQKSSGYELYGR